MNGDMPREVSPMGWFVDVTYLGFGKEAEAFKTQIEKLCMQQGYIALIDLDDELGWVFHTLFTPDGLVSKKDIAQRFEPGTTREKFSEHDLETMVADSLNAKSIRRQVRCTCGFADIVTEDAIYEIKLVLTRDVLFQAIGQVLLYRSAINPSFRAFIVGLYTNTLNDLIYESAKLGITVILWKGGNDAPR